MAAKGAPPLVKPLDFGALTKVRQHEEGAAGEALPRSGGRGSKSKGTPRIAVKETLQPLGGLPEASESSDSSDLSDTKVEAPAWPDGEEASEAHANEEVQADEHMRMSLDAQRGKLEVPNAAFGHNIQAEEQMQVIIEDSEASTNRSTASGATPKPPKPAEHYCIHDSDDAAQHRETVSSQPMQLSGWRAVFSMPFRSKPTRQATPRERTQRLPTPRLPTPRRTPRLPTSRRTYGSRSSVNSSNSSLLSTSFVWEQSRHGSNSSVMSRRGYLQSRGEVGVLSPRQPFSSFSTADTAFSNHPSWATAWRQPSPSKDTPRDALLDSSIPSYTHCVTSSSSGDAPATAILQLDVKRDNDVFFVADDVCSRWGSRFVGFLLLAAGATCFLFAKAEFKWNEALKVSITSLVSLLLFIAGLLLLLISEILFARLYSPVTFHISRVKGAWALILYRRGLAPISRPLDDLEAFIETFGFYSGLKSWLWGRSRGHATSKQGAVHIFFRKSDAGPPMFLTASLQEPLAFFTRLRDVMKMTEHWLYTVTAEYVDQWDGDSSSVVSGDSAFNSFANDLLQNGNDRV